MHSYWAVSDEGRNGQAEGWRDGGTESGGSPQRFSHWETEVNSRTQIGFFSWSCEGVRRQPLLPPPPPPPCLISHWELRAHYSRPQRSTVEVLRPKAGARRAKAGTLKYRHWHSAGCQYILCVINSKCMPYNSWADNSTIPYLSMNKNQHTLIYFERWLTVAKPLSVFIHTSAIKHFSPVCIQYNPTDGFVISCSFTVRSTHKTSLFI